MVQVGISRNVHFSRGESTCYKVADSLHGKQGICLARRCNERLAIELYMGGACGRGMGRWGGVDAWPAS